MFLAGEASGDMHGAALVREIQRQRPGTLCFGLGGPAMAEAGMRLDLDLSSRSVIGFWEVLKHLPFFRRAFRLALGLVQAEKPDLVVPIDYPGFNLRFCRSAKAMGSRLCYYISPQVWAWKAGRVKMMKRILEKILVVFPFETALYAQAGLDCAFVGHPLMDEIQPGRSTASVRRSRGWGARETLVGLLPGSRIQEVQNLLPVMLRTAERLKQGREGLRFLVLKAPGLPEGLYRTLMEGGPAEVLIPGKNEDPYELRRCFDAALVASGTATLETAILGTPFAILYRVHPLTYQIGKRLVKLPYIGLVNVVAGRKVVPEFIQGDLEPSAIAGTLEGLLKAGREREVQLREMKVAVKTLGGPGAARRAALEVLQLALEGVRPRVENR
jgi:lipid-A-disaccharide synthase